MTEEEELEFNRMRESRDSAVRAAELLMNPPPNDNSGGDIVVKVVAVVVGISTALVVGFAIVVCMLPFILVVAVFRYICGLF